MKILLITQEPPLSPGAVVTGNAIRADQLASSLEHAGHQVIRVWFDPGKTGGKDAFGDRDQLRGFLIRHQADVHLVSYWELLDLMPFDSDVPLVLDFLAPRPLEGLFEHPERTQLDLSRLKVDLTKVDLMLVGNQSQRDLVLLPLLETGMDLRQEPGAVVLPLGAEVAGRPASDPGTDGWTLVSGGVDWPWRNSRPYLLAIDAMQKDSAVDMHLVSFTGPYPLKERGEPGTPLLPGMTPMMPYREFSDFLLRRAHIGLELADENVERRVSQSFRSVEFLRHGLPLVCNSYLPIATLVKQYDAGWLVDRPQDLDPLLRDVFRHPGQWRHKSENALRLVRESMDPARVCAPLLQWLERPRKSRRFEVAEPVEPELAVPPWPRRLKALFSMRRVPRGSWIFRWQQKIFGAHRDQGVVFVTRGDLFPADHGAAVKIVETARGLARLGLPVALVTDDRRNWWRLEGGELCRQRVPLWIRMLSWPGQVAKFLHYSKDIPRSNAFLYLPLTDGSFFWRALYAGKAVGARIVQAEFPAYAHPSIYAGRVLDAGVVLVEHNVEYERIRAQVGDLTEEQYQRFRAIEIDLCNRSDAVICVSDNDRQRLATDGVYLSRLHTIPHGVDLEQFNQAPRAGLRAEFSIPDNAPLLVYHGTYSYPPNREALGVFARELLPRLERLGMDCHVLAVGREPPAASPHPRIHLTGSVDSVAPWLKAADLAVVPLLEGGGTRMKIIDCFASGIPVISTSKGIEGIPVLNGRHALVIDDWDEMALAIKRLTDQPETARALVGAAREMASAMDWTAIAGAYIKVYDSL